MSLESNAAPRACRTDRVQVIALAVALALAGPPAPPPTLDPQPWRIVSAPSVHVGARPAVLVTPEEVGAGFTLQVSVFVP
jgi:hypothetical protein